MSQRNISALTVVLVALVIVSILVSMGFGFYYLQQTSVVNQLQSKLATDEAQILSLTNLVSSLQSQVSANSQLQSKVNNDESQISSLSNQVSSLGQLQTSLRSLKSSLESLQSQVQSALSGSETNGNQITQIQSSLRTIQSQVSNIQSSITDLQAKLASLQPQTPISTLVIVRSSFDSTSGTESFVIQNTWNGTVNAQLQVYVKCVNRPGDILNCPNPVGSYTSQVMQFASESTSTVSFRLSQVAILSSGNKDLMVVYLVSATTQVSQEYTLQYPIT